MGFDFRLQFEIEDLELSTSYQVRKICLPFNAMIFATGFMIAESAVMGRRCKACGLFKSIITTWFCSPTFSRTQMYLSDSIVNELNPIFAALIPSD